MCSPIVLKMFLMKHDKLNPFGFTSYGENHFD